jgi:hypothetical protein
MPYKANFNTNVTIGALAGNQSQQAGIAWKRHSRPNSGVI